jgi:DNA-binding NarL/FixJ family response regulator
MLSAELLAAAVSAQPRLELVSLAETDDDMFDVIETKGVHVILYMPNQAAGEQSLDVLKAVHTTSPLTRIIVLTDGRNPNVVVGAFCAGARGFFSLDDSSLDRLCLCIERVHEGQIWANSEELEWVIQALERSSSPSKPFSVVNSLGNRLLSLREEGVVKLLVDGLQNREIAHALNLSEHTIKNYLFRIYDKVGVSSRTELLLYVLTPRPVEMRRVS